MDAQAALLQGKVESAIDICESLRQKLVVPGKGTRKGFEGLLAEIDDFLGLCFFHMCQLELSTSA